MRRANKILLALCILAGISRLEARIEKGGAVPFQRGVALFHPLISATMERGSDRRFVFPPFSDARHTLTENQLRQIRLAGFDFVRLPVDPGPFLQFQGVQRAELDGILRQRLKMILDSGLGVIVDFHPMPRSVDYGPTKLTSGADSPLFRSYCGVLADVARLLEELKSNRVALELMNEPSIGWSTGGYADWQSMIEVLYRTSRGHAPKLRLVLSGGDHGDIGGLTKLDPKAFVSDPAVIFTFHFYLPYEFTEQSIAPSAGNPVRNFELDVPYPAGARPISDSMNALSGVLEKQNKSAIEILDIKSRVLARLLSYRATGFNRSTIKTNLDRVANWARANGIDPSRIFLGEFGVTRRYGAYNGARDPERIEWLRDVREEAEARGFFWAIWTYSGGGGMAIKRNDMADDIDPATLEALGLR